MTTDDWKIGYRKALINHLLSAGAPVHETSSYYGWTSWDMMQHFRKCSVSPVDYDSVTVEENTIYQFQGTFYTGDDSVTVVDLHSVSCTCGEYKDVTWRVESSTGDLIFALLAP